MVSEQRSEQSEEAAGTRALRAAVPRMAEERRGARMASRQARADGARFLSVCAGPWACCYMTREATVGLGGRSETCECFTGTLWLLGGD